MDNPQRTFRLPDDYPRIDMEVIGFVNNVMNQTRSMRPDEADAYVNHIARGALSRGTHDPSRRKIELSPA